MWDDVVLSGAALGAATVTYILFVWSGYTSMQIIFNTALVGVLGCLFWNVAAQIMNREGPPVPKPSVDFVEAKVDALAAHAKGAAVTAAGLGYRLARGQEVNLSLRVALFLYLGAKVGGICSLPSLIYIAVLLAFTAPKLYSVNKDKVDGVAAQMVAKGKELGALAQAQFNEKVLSKIKIPEKKKSAPAGPTAAPGKENMTPKGSAAKKTE